MTRSARLLSAIIVLVAVALPSATASAARDDLLLVSRATGVAGGGGDGNSGLARITADGRFVVFESDANNLSGDDVDGVTDVFRRDLVTGETVLISRADGATGAAGDGSSDDPVVSADGRYVAFESEADNLGGTYNTTYVNIFLRDVESGTTTVVASGNERSEDASMSADGRFVAFTSLANDIHADDTDGKSDVFVRDRETGDLELASRAGGATGAGGDDDSSGPMLSADGRHVAFESRANNLADGELETVTNAFVRDLDPDTTELISRADGVTGTAADETSNYLAITSDGGMVAFSSSATNLSDDDGDPLGDVFLRDRTAATTKLVSRAAGATGAGGDATSHTPSLSADGRFVSFESDATNFSDAHGPFGDVFVRDMVSNRMILVSRAAGAGGAGSDKSSGTYGTAISADGRFVTFESDASNLSDADADAVADVFRRDVLGTAPACGDVTQAVAHGTPATVTLPCTDGDGDAAVRTIESGPLHGTLSAVDGAAGTAVYTPETGYTGPDSFTYRAADASYESPIATVTLEVGPPETGPVAGGGALPPSACADVRRGTRLANTLDGTAVGDLLSGLGGNDVLRGLAGPDCLFGDAGFDRLDGGADDDQVEGGRGADRAVGGAGADRVTGGRGPDRLAGGPGDDELTDRRGLDRLSGGAGDDRIDARDLRRLDRGRRDRIACGTGGADRVRADRRDLVARDCELVQRS